ncbi:MAG: HAD-IIIA family hydrolase [Butyrivibrio sp.]|uniref:HAD family hydrolase n=1 Tax=Butyrivibrio sp. TaxID=28121 RepID=UPI0025CDC947|nr:HAD-IIIA family hydrolase [Butyrivibrio sp.]MCR5771378.1 HAD-IIIA family hydrolase [Butyrivibrio sp.]
MNFKYDNFIFDLYGTLIDIHTDESRPEFWKEIAGFYSCYGADYTFDQLQQKYFDIVMEQEHELAFKLAINYPEIEIQKVFARLLLEAPVHHETESPVARMSEEELVDSQWMQDLCNIFRTSSRDRLRAYPGVIKTLDTIKENGGKIFLLSNAQGMFTRPELEITGLTKYFDAIYISSENQMKKPQPQYMKKLLDDQNITAESSVMIGNEIQCDIAIAASCKVDSILLNTDNLSAIERRARLSRVIDGYFKGYKPETVVSGDISEILDICTA